MRAVHSKNCSEDLWRGCSPHLRLKTVFTGLKLEKLLFKYEFFSGKLAI